ncbi:MAG: GAF domain-containing sensor histidine kinase [Desulfuromonadales bacterium]|nr:GAF domain-containing sensor histidine kinase [Desulfuromonadales bacterium]
MTHKAAPDTLPDGEGARTQREVARLRLLSRLASLTATIRDRSLLLNKVLQQLHEFYAVDSCGIYQLHGLTSPLHLIASLGISTELARELQKVPTGKGLIAEVVKTGTTKSWLDLQQEPQLYCPAILDAGWRGFLAHPLIAHERLLGVIFFFQNHPRQFSLEEIELLGHCCQLIAAAIDTADLVEKLEWQHRLTHASQRELDRSRQQLREHVHRLEESNRSLEQASQMKDRFLSLASHELRTPLTWIMTATEMLETSLPDLPDDSQSLLKTIHKGSNRLNNLVEDLLEMARIEARVIYLARESIDLQMFLGDLANQYADETLRRRLSLEIGSIPEHLSPIGDHHHLRQALERILKNALKFTPPGGVIKLEAVHRTSEELRQQQPEMEPFCPEFFCREPLRDHIDVCISDNGVGIAEQDRLQIFDKFHGAGSINLHGKHHHSVEGPSAGLGLPLAKGMIEAHNGMIWVNSPADHQRGSCFHVLLPLYLPNRPSID